MAKAGLEVFKKFTPQQISQLQNKQSQYYKAAKMLKNTDVTTTLLNAVDLNKKKRQGSLIGRRYTLEQTSMKEAMIGTPNAKSIRSPVSGKSKQIDIMPEMLDSPIDMSDSRLKSALQRDIQQTMMEEDDEHRLTFIVDVDEESAVGREASYQQMVELGDRMIKALDSIQEEEMTQN